MPRKKSKPFPELLNFDFKLVQPRLKGLLINVDRDLQRRVQNAAQANDGDAIRCLLLLEVLLRFAENSWKAVMYLSADIPEDPVRDQKYVLVLPAINRQLLDLLFSIVYMADDFSPRSLQYQRAGWREASEEYHKFKTKYGRDPAWRKHFRNLKNILERLVALYGIGEKEVKNPKLIPYWKHPFELKDEKTASRSFLRYLDSWLYGDTSAQAHLSFGGLIVVAPFLVVDLVGGFQEDLVKGRFLQQYRYMHLCRTAFITLAIATEIDALCRLGNKDATSYLWRMFVEHSEEAKDIFRQRYSSLLESY